MESVLTGGCLSEIGTLGKRTRAGGGDATEKNSWKAIKVGMGEWYKRF